MSSYVAGWVPQTEHVMVGVLLLCLPATLEMIAVIFTLLARETGAHQLGAGGAVKTANVVIGFVTAAFGFYVAVSLLFKESSNKVTPFFRGGDAKESVEPALRAQIGVLPREPGVHKQL